MATSRNLLFVYKSFEKGVYKEFTGTFPSVKSLKKWQDKYLELFIDRGVKLDLFVSGRIHPMQKFEDIKYTNQWLDLGIDI